MVLKAQKPQNNQEALAVAGIRIKKLLEKVDSDPDNAKKYRRQLRDLGYYISKEKKRG